MEEESGKICDEWFEWLIQRDCRDGPHDIVWRRTIGSLCTGLPFSSLVTSFHKIYGGGGGGGEIMMPNFPPQLKLQNQQADNTAGGSDDFCDKKRCQKDLGLDVIEEILRRLPLPSLIRAKSVCKGWNKAISAAPFNPLENNEYHFVMQDMMAEGFQGIAFFSSALNRWFRIVLPVPQIRRDSSDLDGLLYLCAAAAGFLLFLDRNSTHQKPLVIISPVSRQRRELPPLPEWYRWREGTAVELIAHQSGHFDIIALGLGIRFVSTNSHHCILLYNSSTRKWTSVPIALNNNDLWREHAWTSAVHNGVFYFTNDYGAHLGCYDIASNKLEFKWIEQATPPQGIDRDDDENNPYASLPSLVACNGKLLLVGRLGKGTGRSIYLGRFPFIEHTLVGIWELFTTNNNNNTWYWSLISLTPQNLLKDTVESSHGTDFMVAASPDKIWLTVRGSRNLLSLDLKCMEWSVLPGCPAEDIVDTFPRSAVYGTLSFDSVS